MIPLRGCRDGHFATFVVFPPKKSLPIASNTPLMLMSCPVVCMGVLIIFDKNLKRDGYALCFVYLCSECALLYAIFTGHNSKKIVSGARYLLKWWERNA